MLEQAIVDAAALREAALKNAEQAIIEKYAPQIKEAVESMLEGEPVAESHCGSKRKHEEKLLRLLKISMKKDSISFKPKERSLIL